MTPKNKLSVAEVRDALDYFPETGDLIWSKNRRYPGMIAGSVHIKNGYRVVSIGNTLVFAHRIAWAHVTGRWPLRFIDHVNRDRLDNRFCNLREATYSQNAANGPARGSSGIKGVYLRKSGNWNSAINVGGKTKSLGTFKTQEDAASAYARAALAAFGEFARLS